MPNGGPTPDCVHCKHFRRDKTSRQTSCNLHGIQLASPIRAFCSDYVDVEGTDWLDELLDQSRLEAGQMYLWLEKPQTGYSSKFRHVLLTSVGVFGKWTADEFFSAIQEISDKHANDDADYIDTSP